MRKQFRLSEAQLESLIASCKPVPYMVFGGVPPRSRQENANSAWCALGEEMGFDGMTVQPLGSDMRDFTAEVVVKEQEEEKPASRATKEQVYDASIYPLMKQIIAICEEHNIAMVASFAVPNSTDPDLMCTTAFLRDSCDPPACLLRALKHVI